MSNTADYNYLQCVIIPLENLYIGGKQIGARVLIHNDSPFWYNDNNITFDFTGTTADENGEVLFTKNIDSATEIKVFPTINFKPQSVNGGNTDYFLFRVLNLDNDSEFRTYIKKQDSNKDSLKMILKSSSRNIIPITDSRLIILKSLITKQPMNIFSVVILTSWLDCFITDLLQKEGERMELLPHEKYLLSIDEAAEYSGIGSDRLRQIIDENPDLDFIIWRGEKKKQKLIHRKKFESWVMTLSFI